MTSKQKADLLQGTLDLLILKALGLGPMHGYGVGQRTMQKITMSVVAGGLKRSGKTSAIVLRKNWETKNVRSLPRQVRLSHVSVWP
jgi:hypothetical protein